MADGKDTRIVEMQFENKDFERNIAKSQKSLERFKKDLDFDEASKGLEKFAKAAKDTSTIDTLANNIQKLTDKFTAALTLSWENMDYAKRVNNVKRADDLYVVRPEVDYQFKEWLSAGVWYQFRTRNSNWNGADYDSNKTGVFVKAVF